MAVQLILKNSAVQDNHPTAAQLSRGEIALNFHESGPYLSCEDSAGVVKRIAGVTQSATAPSSPLEGTFWWNTGTNQLLLRAEGAWHQLGTGGGGGGGGAVNQLIGGDGVEIDPAAGTGTVTINVDEGNGLTINGGQVIVNLAGDQDGLEFDGGALRASIATADQLGSIRVGNNLTINPTTGVLDAAGGGGGGATDLSVANRNASTLDVASSTGTDATIPAATTTLAGLMTAADKTAVDAGTDLGIANRDADSLDVTSSSGDDVTIPAATQTLAGLLTAADKVIIDGIADPLQYQGTVDLTDAATIPDPATTAVGHTWANIGDGTAPAGWAAVSTLTTGDDVNPGDLIVWNGTTWTYIPTGGVGGGRVIMADEAPFDADAANAGRLWFNTDDLRLFVSYTDDDGDSQWVDTNPGGTGGGTDLTIQDEGTALATAADTLNFVGAGVTATGTGATKTITIPGGGGGAASVGEDPPEAATDANEGEFWFNDDTGQLFISYTDPDDSSSNWIAAAPANADPATPNLQEVTDQGNTTTNGATFGDDVNVDGEIFLLANGQSRFSSDMRVGLPAGFDPGGSEAGAALQPAAGISCTSNGGNVFRGFELNNTTATSTISSDGSSEFAGFIQSQGNAVDGNANGSVMAGAGGLHASNSNTNQELFRGYTTGTATPTSLIRADGSATFAGNISLTNGGAGIVFPAANTGNAGPNCLDDYEEGDWTPSVGGNSTYNRQIGRYTKIGNTVILYFDMSINTLGTGNNDQVNFLPFRGNAFCCGVCSQFSNLAVNIVNLMPVIDIFQGGTGLRDTINFNQTTTASNTTQPSSPFGDGATIACTIIYQTDQ